MNEEKWLNGWYRNGNAVLMGTGVYCAGCGEFLGTTCVVITESDITLETPDWPFKNCCPICELRYKIQMQYIPRGSFSKMETKIQQIKRGKE